MRDCHSIVGLYTYQNRVPFAPSLRWVSCKERDRLPHEGANFHSSFVHYRKSPRRTISPRACWPRACRNTVTIWVSRGSTLGAPAGIMGLLPSSVATGSV